MREISQTYEVKSPNYEILDSRTKLAAQHSRIVNSNFKHGFTTMESRTFLVVVPFCR